MGARRIIYHLLRDPSKWEIGKLVVDYERKVVKLKTPWETITYNWCSDEMWYYYRWKVTGSKIDKDEHKHHLLNEMEHYIRESDVLLELVVDEDGRLRKVDESECLATTWL